MTLKNCQFIQIKYCLYQGPLSSKQPTNQSSVHNLRRTWRSIQIIFCLKPLHPWFSNYTLLDTKIQSGLELKMTACAKNSKIAKPMKSFFLQNSWEYLAEILHASFMGRLGVQNTKIIYSGIRSQLLFHN